MLAPAALEPNVQEIGRQLLAAAREHRQGLFSSRFWNDRLLTWALSDPAFKIQLFRFIDAFPQLSSAGEIHEVLREYLSQPGVTLPPGVEMGLKTAGLAKGLFATTIAGRIQAMAATFIAGADLAAALPVLAKLWKAGSAFSVDLLGETCVSRAEADLYRRRYAELIETLPQRVAGWLPQPRLESDHLGALPRANVSVKLSALDPRVDPADFDGTVQRLVEHLLPLLREAGRRQVMITFDMEEHELKDLTLEVVRRVCATVDFPAGLAVQAYLRAAADDVQQIIDWTRQTGRQITVRLIKGAYWDFEVVRCEQHGWPVPVWTDKRDTDACFERLCAQLAEAIPRTAGAGGVKLAVGSHNIRSIAAALAQVRSQGLPDAALEVQMLYGMADPLKHAVMAHGLRLRQYAPVGPLIPGMAYLVRRLLENASNQSWLRAGFLADASDEELLATPQPGAEPATFTKTTRAFTTTLPGAPHTAGERPREPEATADSTFVNEPPRDFADAAQRGSFAAQIERLTIPAAPPQSTPAQVDAAAERAAATVGPWSETAVETRCQTLLRAAALLRQRRDALAGVIIREAGKPWRDADGEICEAIDFCEFYAQAARRLLPQHALGHLLGEQNTLWYEPRGVAAVISPWNFPVSICLGMTAAALVTGNAVLVKPAEQTPYCGQLVCETLWQAGVPADALQLVPGDGTVGAALVRHQQVALIAFTGSRDVGLEILRVAGDTPPEQTLVKTVVCEMGGKNAIIVDASADDDQAVLGVRQSAFSYAGQKCSACSRLILVGRTRERFLPRLIEATRSLVVGDPRLPATDVGPLIDHKAAEKVRQYLEIGRQEGRLELACTTVGDRDPRSGQPLIGPHIFSGIEPQHRLAREEIFGPVLAVLWAESFEEALTLANASDYRLTGGVYSRQPSHLEAARRRFRVGNLYLNRPITGALVGRQPFGGFGLSGTGAKAGGADYLLHFVQSRSVAENTLRHGFAPGLE